MQIQKQIGEGSFGKVYLAKWKETTVAVKILSNPNGSSDDDFPTRLPNPLLQSLEKVCPHTSAYRLKAIPIKAVILFFLLQDRPPHWRLLYGMHGFIDIGIWPAALADSSGSDHCKPSVSS